MCTQIAAKFPASGSGKGAAGWFGLDHVYVGYDHPFHAPFDHAVSLDFVAEAEGSLERVAVELEHDSARHLAEQILRALDEYERQTGS